MLLNNFSFYKYIRPTWYFNRAPNFGETPYWVDYRKLDSHHQDLITYDTSYSCDEASLWDAAFQAWQKGILMHDGGLSLANSDRKPSVYDNYKFVKKYFNPAWLIYILVMRIFSFKNPIKEIVGFFKALNVKRENIYQVHEEHRGYNNYKAEIVTEKPTVSVILPTLNRYSYLKDAIEDLGKQEIKPLEIIVIDQTDDPDKAFYDQFDQLPLKLIFQDQKGQWLARNRAIQMSEGDYILMFDDDSRIDPDWVTEHLKALEYFKADISAGVSLSTVGAAIPENYSYFRWADQFDSGNALIKREVFEKVGLFDRQYDGQRMGDGEFGMRAYLAGYLSISHPYAKRIHLKVPVGGLRQMGSWDGFRPKKLFAPRPIPSVLFLFRKYFGKRLAILSLMNSVPPSIIPYKFKRNRIMLFFGALLSILILPIVFIQVMKSWKLSSVMIKEGDRIESLDPRK
ncbi:glycosyltransferase family A protein [Fulvivirgaceae bacterium BMA10]|uniref:Glycosyltransferase family A protein n=1 Tax=Splendidivirga corallicola TaxID=3051826 RepID=A0ABT8KX86_9BACT|nr:glycosyltransferase family A protein [Fulvivirgaceae bacterium BMA10]